jgi:hypothetical protein
MAQVHFFINVNASGPVAKLQLWAKCFTESDGIIFSTIAAIPFTPFIAASSFTKADEADLWHYLSLSPAVFGFSMIAPGSPRTAG